MRTLYGLLLLCALLCAGCTASAPYKIAKTVDLHRPAGETTLYFVPFQTVLAPEEISSEIFNRMVDTFDGAAAGSGLTALILKRNLADVDKEWLDKQYYLTGEVFAYRQDSGCCSTDLKLRTRIELYQPGTSYPVLTIDYPYRYLFDHDRSDLESETERMISTLAEELRSALLTEIAPL